MAGDGPGNSRRGKWSPAAAKRVADAASRITRVPYTKGLPEWEMFPTDADRIRAIEDIEKGMVPRSWRGLAGFVLVVMPSIFGPLIALLLLRDWLFPQGFRHDGAAVFGLTLLIYCLIIYALLRRAMPRDLRKRLIRCGVPVCMKCGYALKGLPADRTRCPECGRTFSAAVRAIVADPRGRAAAPVETPDHPVD